MAKFLVIDDDNTMRQLIVATLENVGHRVTQAATGQEGVASFKQQPPDVVITDIVMPDDSIEQVIALRQQHPAVPFIVVSGLSAQSARSVDVAKLLGARRTLPKPFRLPDLLGVTDEVLAELEDRKKARR